MALQEPCSTSVITVASAWRAKYRKVTPNDNMMVRVKIRVECLGVHPKNRGGVFPAGIRCRNLCTEVIDVGFVKEEVNHAVVVVEEMPLEQVRSRGVNYLSGSRYNREQSSKDDF